MTPRPLRAALFLVVAGSLTGGAAACTAPRSPRVVNNPDPSGKIPAIKAAAQTRDPAAVSQLVKDLDSDDPAVRFYAVQGLRRITGESFGYRFYNDADARKPAVDRWKAWLATQPAK